MRRVVRNQRNAASSRSNGTVKSDTSKAILSQITNYSIRRNLIASYTNPLIDCIRITSQRSDSYFMRPSALYKSFSSSSSSTKSELGNDQVQPQ